MRFLAAESVRQRYRIDIDNCYRMSVVLVFNETQGKTVKEQYDSKSKVTININFHHLK